MLNFTWRYLQAAHCFQKYIKKKKKQQQQQLCTNIIYLRSFVSDF